MNKPTAIITTITTPASQLEDRCTCGAAVDPTQTVSFDDRFPYLRIVGCPACTGWASGPQLLGRVISATL